MKLLNVLFSVIVMALWIVGCSMGNLSEDDAMTIALEFAKTNAKENKLTIDRNELTIIQTERADNMDKWVVYIVYPNANNSNETKLSPSGWVSVSDSKNVLGYNFTLWGGDYKQD